MKVLLSIALAILLAGCGSVISRSIIEQADRKITLAMVQEDPDRYTGSIVIWGGIIVASENLESTTEIEVIQTRLTWGDRPSEEDSLGRFIIEAPGFLDTVIYKKDKLITVAGRIKGIKIKKIGKMDYRYPVLEPLEIKLFEPAPEIDYRELPPWWYSPYPYYPYGPYYPYPWPYYPYGPYYPYPPPH